jgi:hypothetical protein
MSRADISPIFWVVFIFFVHNFVRDGDIYDHIAVAVSSARRLFAMPSSKHRREQWAD